ncbi:MAG TPA: Clp protease N-terminal domain-containing protein [Actinomycetota bacterium]|nr:Clp protease N-terminal domain-containing protein [Actinomycetota bacterium]
MFERFTPDARRAVEAAIHEAVRMGHDHVGPGHLLLAVATGAPSIATLALSTVGFDPDRARAELSRTDASPPTLDDSDADALRALGVDVDEVRRRTEAAFGPGALDRQRRWHGWRRGRVCGLSFDPETKKALEVSLREAIRLGQRSIGPEAVLLGLVRTHPSAIRLLEAQGVDRRFLRDEVERAVLRRDRRGA